MAMDNPGHTPAAPEWLTLTEAAARSGHTREALRQRVRRGSLKARRRNTDGQTEIWAADLANLPPPELLSLVDQGQPGDAAEALALAVLRETVDDLRSTVADLTADLGRTRSALDAAQAAHLVDRGRAERAEAEAAAASARVAAAEVAASEARAAAERRAEELAAEHTRAAVATAEANGLRERVQKAEERADRLEADARRPWWRKLIG
ncbi:hypothetical protein [Belnapia sp. F-4-1]|uniref:hypothetical protein n=1 Tax=Belnapia sp. F-4-1 TaxID=1545443 RepID=UPI0005B76A8B|nr:hypothetical protein [Belnapia sp. F-4-1]